MGRERFAEATTLLITADARGSNGYRVRAWKVELARLAQETGLTITVCHHPPGTSQWNRIVIYTGFPGVYEVTNEPAPSPLEMLTSLRTTIELISATSTSTGLTIQADYDPNWYLKGVKISDRELAAHHSPHTAFTATGTTPSTFNQSRREPVPR